MSFDDDRLQRYLEWKRACERERAERRRRAIGYVAVPAIFVLVVGLAAWLGQPAGDQSAAVNAVTTANPADTATSAPAPTSAATADAPEPPVVQPARPAPPEPRAAPAIASPPRVRPAPTRPAVPDALATSQPAPPDEPAGDSDVAAATAPAPVSPPPIAASEVSSEPRPPDVPREPREAVTETPREALVPASAPRDVIALPAPSHETRVEEPRLPDLPPPSGGAASMGPPTARERVASWAKGEVQEFRDGVKREMREFRSGYEKIRGLFRR